MKVLFSLVLTFISFNLTSQKISQLQDINKDVWYPFIDAFGKLDADAFMKVHSPDVLRWTLDEGKTMDRGAYTAEQKSSTEYHIKNESTRSLELRFIHRSIRDNFAYEVGYYKLTFYEKGKTNPKEYFGKFNVILRKEEGVWKILMDADHGGATFTDFIEAYGINSYSKFPAMLLKKNK